MCFKCDEGDATPDDAGSDSMEALDESPGIPYGIGVSPAMEGMMMLAGLVMLCIIFIVVAGVAALISLCFES